MSSVHLNITVPVFNRPELTERTIESIHTTRFPFSYCVTAVDNGSSKETVKLLISLKNKGLINNLFLCENNLGVSCAANIGWRAVDSPLYMKLDNDIEVKNPDWLITVLNRWRHVDNCSTIAACWREYLYKASETFATPDGELAVCPTNLAGSAIIIPRQVRELIGYWSEDYGLYGAEDGDYGLRMNTIGAKQYYYKSSGLLVTNGHDDSVYMEKGLNKHEQINQLFIDKSSYWGLFNANALFFSLGIRKCKIPLKYEVDGVDANCNVKIRISQNYLKFRKGLMLCRNILKEVCKDGEFTTKMSQNAVEHLRQIMQKHGDL